MEVRINPKSSSPFNTSELWRYRELFYFLAWRDMKVRYKQTVIGIIWAILQPLLTMIVFTIFFHNTLGVSSGKIPYVVFSFTGLIYWNYFYTSLNDVTNSYITNQSIITKVYFPRLIIPLSYAITGIADFFVSLLLLIIFMIIYNISLTLVGFFIIVPTLLLTTLSIFGFGIFLSILNVKYRDIRYVLPFFIQLLLFVTPVIYSLSSVPEQYRLLLFINPMTGVIETARAGILGYSQINWIGYLISLASSVVACTISLLYFKKYETEITDIL